MLNNTLRREHGQSIVLITLLMVGLIAILGLVFDGGNAYLQRRRMQDAADASAFAGAKMLALAPNGSAVTECAIRVVIETYAKSNGMPGPNPDPSCNSLNSNVKAYFVNASGNQVGVEIGLNAGVPNGAQGVRVIPQTTFNTFFLGIVNESLGAVAATATAIYGGVKAPASLAPLGVQCSQASLSSCFTPGNSYNIREGGGPGNFGWLSWNGENNAGYVADELDPNQNTLSGYIDPVTGCHSIAIGCWVQGAPGNMNSNDILAQLNNWITVGQSGTPMFVPIWDIAQPDNGNGGGANLDYHLVGFAAFVLQGYDLTGGVNNPDSVTGKFVKFVTPGDFCGTGCMDTGLKTTILTQ
jgi:Flp pilus assembly protein TadG